LDVVSRREQGSNLHHRQIRVAPRKRPFHFAAADLFIIMKKLLHSFRKYALLESRISDVKRRHGDKISDDELNYLASHDPSGNHKYLPWMAKMFVSQDLSHKTMELIQTFDSFAHLIPKELRDINQFRSAEEFEFVVRDAITKETENRMQNLQERERIKIIDDENYLVVVPLSHAASCKYGKSTRWCISAKDDPEEFRTMGPDGGATFYIIIPKIDAGEDKIVIDVQYNPYGSPYRTIWNSADEEFNFNESWHDYPAAMHIPEETFIPRDKRGNPMQ